MSKEFRNTYTNEVIKVERETKVLTFLNIKGGCSLKNGMNYDVFVFSDGTNKYYYSAPYSVKRMRYTTKFGETLCYKDGEEITVKISGYFLPFTDREQLYDICNPRLLEILESEEQ